jgi:site-specific recombinase XerD
VSSAVVVPLPVHVDPLDTYLGSWARSLRALGRSERTVGNYRDGLRAFARWLAPRDVLTATRADVEAHLADLARTAKPSSVALRHSVLRAWFRFAVDYDLLDRDPMAKVRPPKVEPEPVPVLTDDELAALVAACKGTGVLDRRDMAMVRLLIDTGCRRGELAGLRLGDVDLDAQIAVVVGKGARRRVVAYGAQAAAALDRWISVRSKMPQSQGSDALWIGRRGPLGDEGIAVALKVRAEAAGIEHFHPHRLRHTFAHRWMLAGGAEGDLQALGGWRSREMLSRYGASAASERARVAHRRLGLGDRIG